MKLLAMAPGMLSILLVLTACSSRQELAPYESRVAAPGTEPAESEPRSAKSRRVLEDENIPSNSAGTESNQLQTRHRDNNEDAVKSQPGQQKQAETATQAEQIKQSVMAKMENSSESHTFPADAELRWTWPVKGKIVRSYRASDPARRGILISGEEGEAIAATESGEVVYSAEGLPGYGQLIIIKHNKNYLSVYAHNRQRLVAEGEWVERGAQIATMGRSSSNAALHFEIRHNGDPQDPLKHLP
ncbi:MAG: peptidoglycan DD-metalloendopeptidase family protein [Pseudomonadota bacterium]|nr:peptidoglycan DD-metalloendopeptidase family protein [Pseudomonadota bacterium]